MKHLQDLSLNPALRLPHVRLFVFTICLITKLHVYYK
jgi:hypothetical protein